MRFAYPVLKECPVLLPVFWVVRWFDALFLDRDKLHRGMIVLRSDSADVSKYDEHMAAVGLKERR